MQHEAQETTTQAGADENVGMGYGPLRGNRAGMRHPPGLPRLLENRKPPEMVYYVEPRTITSGKPHHAHTKDAAETAKLNRQMLEQHEGSVASDPFDMNELPKEFAEKVERCHKKGMGAGRLITHGALTDIKCYER
jgi:hypothetical protein